MYKKEEFIVPNIYQAKRSAVLHLIAKTVLNFTGWKITGKLPNDKRIGLDIEPKLNEDVLEIFDLKRSVDSKKSLGGTSFDNIKKMLKNYKKELK